MLKRKILIMLLTLIPIFSSYAIDEKFIDTWVHYGYLFTTEWKINEDGTLNILSYSGNNIVVDSMRDYGIIKIKITSDTIRQDFDDYSKRIMLYEFENDILKVIFLDSGEVFNFERKKE